jgi:hypothetical protein
VTEKTIMEILVLFIVYFLITGKWPEDTPEMRQAIREALDRTEENSEH